jgi:hypothetical protein
MNTPPRNPDNIREMPAAPIANRYIGVPLEQLNGGVRPVVRQLMFETEAEFATPAQQRNAPSEMAAPARMNVGQSRPSAIDTNIARNLENLFDDAD